MRGINRILSVAWQIFQDPKTIFVSIFIGILVGLFQHDWVVAIAPYNELYSRVLRTWVLPILFLGITMTAIKFVANHTLGERFKAISILLGSSVVLVGVAIHVAGVILTRIARFDTQNLEHFGEMVAQTQSEYAIELPVSGAAPGVFPEHHIIDFILEVIPQNVFAALSYGETIKVVFFAVVVGICIGSLRPQKRSHILTLLQILDELFGRSASWFKVILPLGIGMEVAVIFDQIGWGGLVAMKGFAIAIVTIFALTYLVSFIILWKRSQASLVEVGSAIKSPALFVLATGESLAAIPYTIAALHESLNFDRDTSDLIAPLAISLCRLGSVIYFSVAVLFVAELYNSTLDLGEISIVIVGSILGAIASAEVSDGDGFLALLAPILSILALPFDAVFILLQAVEIAISPFRELCTVLAGMAVAAAIARPETASSGLKVPSSQLERVRG